jgi:hypothetical protein
VKDRNGRLGEVYLPKSGCEARWIAKMAVLEFVYPSPKRIGLRGRPANKEVVCDQVQTHNSHVSDVIDPITGALYLTNTIRQTMLPLRERSSKQF